MHSDHPNVERKVLLVAVNRCSMRVCFWPYMTVVAVENPTYAKNLIYTSPVDTEENHKSSSNQ